MLKHQSQSRRKTLMDRALGIGFLPLNPTLLSPMFSFLLSLPFLHIFPEKRSRIPEEKSKASHPKLRLRAGCGRNIKGEIKQTGQSCQCGRYSQFNRRGQSNLPLFRFFPHAPSPSPAPTTIALFSGLDVGDGSHCHSDVIRWFRGGGGVVEPLYPG